ncbi:MAG: hypothetical protein F4X65_06505 [Chloroflexi bacterium]|nr:hypothetical protein [Chloroflexota bacterium]
MVTKRFLEEKFLNPWLEKREAEFRAQKERAARIRRKLKAEALDQARAEGAAEGMAAERVRWQAWNRRRMESEARGDSFDEPPPEPMFNGYGN